jgi:hypothetical protein
MKRRLHKMFPWLHTFEPYELLDERPPGPFDVKVWYLGFRCKGCKADGYRIPLGR